MTDIRIETPERKEWREEQRKRATAEILARMQEGMKKTAFEAIDEREERLGINPNR